MTQFVTGTGGAQLAVHRLGTGRPVVLLHGLFSSAEVNWIKFGTAAKLVEAGFEAIMPDLRAHGLSDAPHDPAAYPAGVLVDDLRAVIEALGFEDYDLGGFSLGTRTALQGVIAGLSPRRLVLGGMGLEGLIGWRRRTSHFIDVIDRFGTIERGDPAYLAQQFMKSMQVDRVASRLLLESLQAADPAGLELVTMPTLAVCGNEDHDNGSAQKLAGALADARYVAIPGTHMSSVTKPELGAAMVAFLST